jgi:hypothetical protein
MVDKKLTSSPEAATDSEVQTPTAVEMSGIDNNIISYLEAFIQHKSPARGFRVSANWI